MKKLVKFFSIVALLVASVFGMASCEMGSKVDTQHTIVFYHTMSQTLQDVLQTAIDTFEEKYPGWKVSATQVGGYDDVRNKIVGDLPAGNQPDLAYCYADHVALYLGTKKVINLSQYINSTETVEDAEGNVVNVGYTQAEINDFVTGYYAEGLATNYENYAAYGYDETAMFTLPFAGKSTELMYYNKTALDKLHLTPATTWAELWEQCAIIKEAYPTSTPLGYDSDANWFITMCAQNGWDYTAANGNHYLFNNENTKGWLQDIKDKYDKHYFVTQNTYGTYTSGLFTLGVEDEAGGCVYCIGSSGGASHQNPGNLFEWGIAPIPGNHAISQGPDIVMFKSSTATDPEEKALYTFLFLKEILEPTFQAAFCDASGYAPSRKSTFEVPAYAAKIADTTNITMVAASVCRQLSLQDGYLFTSPAFDGSSNARDNVGTILKYVLTGEKTPAEALADGVRNCGGNN